MKRLIQCQSELHRGEAVEFALGLTHPFTRDAALDVDLPEVYNAIAADPADVVARRQSLLDHWGRRARDPSMAPFAGSCVRSLTISHW